MIGATESGGQGWINLSDCRLPMHNFCGLNGIEQAIVPLVSVGESLIGRMDMTVLVERQGNRWIPCWRCGHDGGIDKTPGEWMVEMKGG